MFVVQHCRDISWLILFRIADFAAEKNVRLMVDAEQTYFQPAINHLVHLLQLKHNKAKPIIFHTYQCYLADSMQRVAKDIERAKREDYFFAAKVVRGSFFLSFQNKIISFSNSPFRCIYCK
jgi:proline dehydrogenase